MKLLTSIILFFAVTVLMHAQVPQGVKYQAAVRNNNGELQKNKKVSFEISIIQGAIDGSIIFTETHIDTTDDNGIVNLNIGQGSPESGTFGTIDWSNAPYFMRISMDINGGTSYQVMGTSELLSVPYALYSGNSDKLDGKTEAEFASAGHTHTELPVAYGYIYSNGTLKYDHNVSSSVWNSSLGRYEITITNYTYSINSQAMVSIRGDAGSCPAGAVARTGSVSGNLLIYIVDKDGNHIQCYFDFVVFGGAVLH